jgi:dihydrofolate reductase
MRKIVVVENVSLDGVMQAPGRPDEDVRGGFAHGGWATRYEDGSRARLMAEGMGETGAMLFGRRTYEDFFNVWPKRTDGNPFTPVLNNTPKYVASRTLTEPLPWQNSTLLRGEAADAVAQLKSQPGKDIVVLGSGELVQSLTRRGLVDRYVLLIHPLLLGSGRRLFADEGVFASLGFVDAKTTSTGVVVATYEGSAR